MKKIIPLLLLSLGFTSLSFAQGGGMSSGNPAIYPTLQCHTLTNSKNPDLTFTISSGYGQLKAGMEAIGNAKPFSYIPGKIWVGGNERPAQYTSNAIQLELYSNESEYKNTHSTKVSGCGDRREKASILLRENERLGVLTLRLLDGDCTEFQMACLK